VLTGAIRMEQERQMKNTDVLKPALSGTVKQDAQIRLVPDILRRMCNENPEIHPAGSG